MSDRTETLAAILAEMRGNEFDDPHLDADGIIGARRLARDWADRIEAAAARERDEDRQLAAIAESDEAFARCARCDRPERAPGNAAAMREALTAFAGYLTQKRIDEVWAKTTLPEPGLDRLVEQARRALAAPARNCDRFATEDEAREAYWAYRDPLEFNGRPFVSITEWLFAPSAQ